VGDGQKGDSKAACEEGQAARQRGLGEERAKWRK